MNARPVHIITGFLGAGKTTFLNHFIKQKLPDRILVIENECGATNVDGALIMDAAEEVVELTAGCLCCSLSDGLLDILEEGYKRRDQFDRMIIETTGIADPSSIVQVFLQNPAVEKAYDLQQVICLVDADQLEEWLDEVEEALRQVVAADVLLVNKIDTVSAEKREQVYRLLEGINPHAKILTGSQGIFPVEEIMSVGTTKPESSEHISHLHHHEHVHSGEGSNNSHKINTFTLTFPHPLDLNDLQLDLNRIVHLYRDQVYRVKGFIAIPGYPNRVILQSARSAFIITDGSPWEDEVNREGKVVFIGRGIKKEVFEKMFNRHMVEPKKTNFDIG